mmetsp:Transcript_24948/g.61297  ORF Transcript_24948/g.61297 Transcript_24948/m.61297 type:complete len:176 (+) Transcript_24948:642-1169(+)
MPFLLANKDGFRMIDSERAEFMQIVEHATEAEQKGCLEGVRLLIENGADVNAAERTGATPLIAAASSGHVECARLLIQNGADVDVTPPTESTALSTAAKKGGLECTRLLIKNGADVNAAHEDGYTVLMAAAGGGDADVLKLLVENGGRVLKQRTAKVAVRWIMPKGEVVRSACVS